MVLPPLVLSGELSYNQFSDRLNDIKYHMPLVGRLRYTVPIHNNHQFLEDYLAENEKAANYCDSLVSDTLSLRSMMRQKCFTVLARQDNYIRPPSLDEKAFDISLYPDLAKKSFSHLFYKVFPDDKYFGPDRIMYSIFTMLMIEGNVDINDREEAYMQEEYSIVDSYKDKRYAHTDNKNHLIKSVHAGYRLYYVDYGQTSVEPITKEKAIMVNGFKPLLPNKNPYNICFINKDKKPDLQLPKYLNNTQ